MELEKLILGIIKSNIENQPDVTLDMKLMEDLKVDSFELLMIFSAIEDELHIAIDGNDIMRYATIREMIDYLAKQYPDIKKKYI